MNSKPKEIRVGQVIYVHDGERVKYWGHMWLGHPVLVGKSKAFITANDGLFSAGSLISQIKSVIGGDHIRIGVMPAGQKFNYKKHVEGAT